MSTVEYVYCRRPHSGPVECHGGYTLHNDFLSQARGDWASGVHTSFFATRQEFPTAYKLWQCMYQMGTLRVKYVT